MKMEVVRSSERMLTSIGLHGVIYQEGLSGITTARASNPITMFNPCEHLNAPGLQQLFSKEEKMSALHESDICIE
jgi:hypothetical protein